MPLIITKNGSRNFSHFDGFKSLNASLSYGMILDETDNTAIVTLPNGSVFPHTPVNSSDITVIDGATTNTYATVELLRARLVALGYPPFVEVGGGGGGATDLGYTPSPTNGIVTSSTGTDATIPLADGTNAGLSENNLSDTLKTAYDGAVTDVATITGVLSDFENDINDINTALTGKQDNLTFDSTPTNSSTNPVTSGGVFTALALKAAIGSTFSIRLQASSFNPADSTTYYVNGSNNLTPSTTNNRFVYAGITASKFKLSFFIYNNGTLGSSENVVFKLLNNTQSTQTTITSTAKFNSLSFGYVGEHTLAITEGDELSLCFETPVFAPNPTSIIIGCNLMLIQ